MVARLDGPFAEQAQAVRAVSSDPIASLIGALISASWLHARRPHALTGGSR
jgi:hypothetical protein